MFAVLKTGGKQYKVSPNDVILVEKLSAQTGDVVQFDKIMMIGDDKVDIGVPNIEGAAVHAEVLEQSKSKKVISFVKRRRKHSSKRTRGHRQNITVLRVQKILTSGAKDTGEKIEVGVSVIGINTKAPAKSVMKSESTKKSVKKTEPIKKSVTKSKAVKKPVREVEETKKQDGKATVAKKLAAKAKALEKSESKVKPTKKPTTTKKTG